MKPTGTMEPPGSPPISACITSRWLIAAMIARRTPTLLVGDITWLGRNWLMNPHFIEPLRHRTAALQGRQQIWHRLLDPIDLAGQQRIRRGVGLGDHPPLHAIDHHAMPARREARRFIARRITVEFRERREAADDLLIWRGSGTDRCR